jgi:uncharacterized membrane protein YvlD (DUF360 family)
LRYGLRLAGWLLRGWRPTPARLGSLLSSGIVTFLALAVTVWLLPGVSVSGPQSLLTLVVVLAVVGAVLRPVLTALAVAIGAAAVLVVALITQVAIVYTALRLTPGVASGTLPEAIAAAWMLSLVTTMISWPTPAATTHTWAMYCARSPATTIRTPPAHHPGWCSCRSTGCRRRCCAGWSPRATCRT